MKSRKLTIALAVGALIPLGAAVAGDGDQYGNKGDKSMSSANFKKLDTNKDGRISQAEAAADSTIVFSSADTNGDGYLDSDEWKASSKGSNTPQPQSMPSSPNPPSSEPVPEPSQGVPPSGERTPDTENPRQ
jgi:EF hand domain-containing protein